MNDETSLTVLYKKHVPLGKKSDLGYPEDKAKALQKKPYDLFPYPLFPNDFDESQIFPNDFEESQLFDCESAVWGVSK